MLPRTIALKHDIAKLENELCTLEAAENSLVGQLQDLQLVMQKHRSHIKQLRYKSTPIGSIPNEILIAIFEARQPAFEDREEYAMCISQVSKLWRGVALNMPSLWCSIRIDYQWCGKGQLRMLDLFIERSCENPLEIYISMIRDDDQYYWDGFYVQTGKIFPLVSRWRSLLVCGTIREDISSALLDLAHVNAPLLESFQVKMEWSAEQGDGEDDFDQPFFIFQGGTPKLTQIEIREISITACQPPLSSIVSLRLHHPPRSYNIDQYRDILLAPNRLVDLHLVGNVIGTAQLHTVVTSGSAPIKIPSLRSLTVSPSWSAGSFTIYSLLASLDTPALHCLTLHCCPWQNHVSEFQETFQNYGPPRYPVLRSLTMRYADFSQPGAIWFTSMLPSITCLSLIECGATARFLSLLLGVVGSESQYNLIAESPSFRHESSSIHLPQLRHICLSMIDLTGLLVLCDIISQRISLGRPVTSLQIYPAGVIGIPVDKFQWLRERVQIKIHEQQ